MAPVALGQDANAAGPPAARRRADRWFWVQSLAIAVTAALGALTAGRPGLASALAGTAIAWVTTSYASHRASVPEREVGAALRRVMIGEFIKVLATVALFAAATRLSHVDWPALLCGYVVGLVCCWLPAMAASGGKRELTGARAAAGRGAASLNETSGLE